MTFRLNDLIFELLENLPPLPPINYALIQGISIFFFFFIMYATLLCLCKEIRFEIYIILGNWLPYKHYFICTYRYM